MAPTARDPPRASKPAISSRPRQTHAALVDDDEAARSILCEIRATLAGARVDEDQIVAVGGEDRLRVGQREVG